MIENLITSMRTHMQTLDIDALEYEYIKMIVNNADMYAGLVENDIIKNFNIMASDKTGKASKVKFNIKEICINYILKSDIKIMDNVTFDIDRFKYICDYLKPVCNEVLSKLGLEGHPETIKIFLSKRDNILYLSYVLDINVSFDLLV